LKLRGKPLLQCGYLCDKIEKQHSMISKQFLPALAICLLCASGISAQKYGHLNLGNAVAMMPETKAADSALDTYSRQLVAKGEEMVKKFQDNYNAFVKEYQAGTMTPLAQKTGEEALQKERGAIVAYDEEMKQKIENKRQELLLPIFEKVQAALDELAKEKGYMMVFDSSVFNTLLFAAETDDLMPMLKAKLGIVEEPKK
jgi:outer membrane protein